MQGWHKEPSPKPSPKKNHLAPAVVANPPAGGNFLQFKDDWEIEVSDLVFEKEIASGTFGSVWKGQFLRTPCAIKKLHGM